MQTAEIAAKVLGRVPIQTTRTLLPSAKPAALWSTLQTLDGAQRVLVAGHEPHLSRFAAFLLNSPAPVEIKKGALLKIRIEAPSQTPQGILQWLLPPALVR